MLAFSFTSAKGKNKLFLDLFFLFPLLHYTSCQNFHFRGFYLILTIPT